MNTAPSSKRSPVRLAFMIVTILVVMAAVVLGVYLYQLKTRGIEVERTQITCEQDNKIVHPQADTKWPDLGEAADTKKAIDYVEPDQFSKGRGIWIQGGKSLNNQEITRALDKNPHILEIYYDYTCNFCNDFDSAHAKEIDEIATGGKHILLLRPVISHNGPMAIPGNEVISWVAANNPEKVWNFQKAMASVTSKYFTTDALGEISKAEKTYLNGQNIDFPKLCKDVNAGNEQAKGLFAALNPLSAIDAALEKVGIDPSEVSLPKHGHYSQASTEAFQERFPGDAGTPKVLVDGKTLTPQQMSDPKTISKLFSLN